MANSALRKLSNVETASFCSQMHMILEAGISAFEGIEIMLDDVQAEEEKELLGKISEKLTETGLLNEALAAAGVFPEYMLRMTKIGEESGRLDEVMKELAEYYNREDEMAKNIRSAIIYPVTMAMMMMAVIVLLVVKVMPVFTQVFEEMGTEVSGVSLVLMNMGTALSRYAVIFVTILLIVCILLLIFFRTKAGHKVFLNTLETTKMTRNIQEKTAACRFCGGMSLMLLSGLTEDESIDLAGKLVEYPFFDKKVENCKKFMEEGMALDDALAKAEIVSGLYARMLHVSARTGTTAETFNEIANGYQNEADTALNSVISLIGPTLVAILAIVTGLILLSVMLPVMGILSGM